MVATKRGGRPSFSTALLLGLLTCVLVLSFQNCSVDLLSSTPGASTSGSCGSATAQALTDLQPIISGSIQTNCSTCHGVNNGSVKSGFYVPDVGATASDPAVQSFTYTQLCVRGGKAVGLKIDGSNSHGGGTFTRGGALTPFFNYLDTYFP